MAVIKIKVLIQESVMACLGKPLLPVEMDIQDIDYSQALIKYYAYLPLRAVKNYQFTADREVSQSISELISGIPVSKPEDTEDLFYVGVANFSVRLQTSSIRLNEYLLGTDYVFPNAEPMKQSLLNTQMGENVGDPYYEEDFLNNKVNWVVGGNCTLSVSYGFGSLNIGIIPMRHLELMSALVGCSYYKRLLAIRNTGVFPGADFSINTTLLESALKEAQSKVDEILGSIGIVPATIG
jgi:hypothetical protein